MMSKWSLEELAAAGIGPLHRARQQAAAVSSEELVRLFLRLEKATKLFHSEPRRRRAGVLSALRAINRFIPGGNELLAILMREIADAPTASPGDVLHPYLPGQAIETRTRQDVDRLKACCAYAALKLTPSRSGRVRRGLRQSHKELRTTACRQVAQLCLEYSFPYAEFFKKDGSKKVGPTLAAYTKRINDYITHYPTKSAVKSKAMDAAAYFRQLRREKPFAFLNEQPEDWQNAAGVDRTGMILCWLESEFIAAGYRQSGRPRFGP